MIHLSFDQDWAPPWATLALHEALAAAGLRGTLFVTHDCPSLAALRAAGRLELGWHPNFLPGSSHGATVEEVLDTCALLVPEAAGARAHGLMRGTSLLLAYRDRGLLYDAADLRDGAPGHAPFVSWTGLARLPIWFEDDVHLRRGLPCTLEALDLASPGLRVMNFHPVLVALNAADLDGYAGLKAALAAAGTPLTEASERDFAPFVERERPGVGDLLREVVAWLGAHPRRAGGPLREVALGTVVD